jgi:hypothetical protein
MTEDVDFSNDVEIAEGYKKFSGELLRVSLLAITGCAILWLKLKTADEGTRLQIEWAWLDWSFICFCLAAACALMHLYFANDSLALELERRRRELKGGGIDRIVRVRDWQFKLCKWLIVVGSALIMIAVVLLGIGVLTAKRAPTKPAGGPGTPAPAASVIFLRLPLANT